MKSKQNFGTTEMKGMILVQLIKTDDSDYEYLLYGVTPQQYDDYMDYMDNSPCSGVHSVHRFHVGNPDFLILYLSTSTKSAREMLLDYWIEQQGAEYVEYDLPVRRGE